MQQSQWIDFYNKLLEDKLPKVINKHNIAYAFKHKYDPISPLIGYPINGAIITASDIGIIDLALQTRILPIGLIAGLIVGIPRSVYEFKKKNAKNFSIEYLPFLKNRIDECQCFDSKDQICEMEEFCKQLRKNYKIGEAEL